MVEVIAQTREDAAFVDALEKIAHTANVRAPALPASFTRREMALRTRSLYPRILSRSASAGHGLNLQQGGNVIVWFGLTWSLELYEQTNARLWRQGQQAGAVVVQHIVTAGTIDERILEAISHKEKGQNALIEAVKAEL